MRVPTTAAADADLVNGEQRGDEGQLADKLLAAGEGGTGGPEDFESAEGEGQRGPAAVGLVVDLSAEGVRPGTAAAAVALAPAIQGQEEVQTDGVASEGACLEEQGDGIVSADPEEDGGQATGRPALEEGAEVAAARAGPSQPLGRKSKRYVCTLIAISSSHCP